MLELLAHSGFHDLFLKYTHLPSCHWSRNDSLCDPTFVIELQLQIGVQVKKKRSQLPEMGFLFGHLLLLW